MHAFITELVRPIGTHLYGRRLYETMAYWDAPIEGYPPEHRDFARVWQQAEKIVFFTHADRRDDAIACEAALLEESHVRGTGSEAVPH